MRPRLLRRQILGHLAIVPVLTGLVGLLLWASPAVAQNNPKALPAGGNGGRFEVTRYGAIPDGVTDCTKAFQAAIDDAARTGGVVEVPAGRFLFKGHLVLEAGVHLVGVNSAPQSREPQTGSILLPTEGRDKEAESAFIQMRSSTSISGLTFYYPEQKTDDIRPYPWTVEIRAATTVPGKGSFDSTVENVTLINSYNGIRAGTTENGRHHLVNINGCVLRRGIMIDFTGDIGRIQNVHFHCHFWEHAAFGGNWDRVFAYMQKNLEAFIFGRTDWQYVNDTFVFPANIGYRFIETTNGSCNGQFSGIGADACSTCLLVESLQPQGIAVVNGEFNAHRVGRETQLIVQKTCRANLRFSNCAFWGPVEQNVLLDGPSFLSFGNCYFSNDDARTNSYAIRASDGRLQVENCTFDARSKKRLSGHAFNQEDVRPPLGAVYLQNGVRHAIIRANNGYYGVSVKNEIGDRAIINDNEPFQPPKTNP